MLLYVSLIQLFEIGLYERRNYTISPSSLPCVHNWSVGFQVSAIGSSSFQNEQYLLTSVSSIAYMANGIMTCHFFK